MAIPVEIIGIGLSIDDITEKQRKIINNADLLVAGERYLDYFRDLESDKLVIKRDIDFIADQIKSRMEREKIVVLASGDPLFFGIGASLIKRIGRENIKIHPNISSAVSAFALIKEPWHDACFISLHGKKDFKQINDILLKNDKIAILTDPDKNPSWIADKLINAGFTDFEFYVFENIGNTEEKNFRFDSASKVKGLNFKSPNIVILKRKPLSSRNEKPAHSTKKFFKGDIEDNAAGSCIKDDFLSRDIVSINSSSDIDGSGLYTGMPDNMFSHEKGLITKSEIRCIVLSKLRLISDCHVLWDIGAGSGSVSIEASKFIPNGSIFAFEKNYSRICDIRKNIDKFKADNINIMHAEFPHDLGKLPDPDRIFIGGGGRELLEIINIGADRLVNGGIIVITLVLLQSIEPCLSLLRNKGFEIDLVQVQISRLSSMPFGDRLASLNPVWIISGLKKTIISEDKKA